MNEHSCLFLHYESLIDECFLGHVPASEIMPCRCNELIGHIYDEQIEICCICGQVGREEVQYSEEENIECEQFELHPPQQNLCELFLRILVEEHLLHCAHLRRHAESVPPHLFADLVMFYLELIDSPLEEIVEIIVCIE